MLVPSLHGMPCSRSFSGVCSHHFVFSAPGRPRSYCQPDASHILPLLVGNHWQLVQATPLKAAVTRSHIHHTHSTVALHHHQVQFTDLIFFKRSRSSRSFVSMALEVTWLKRPSLMSFCLWTPTHTQSRMHTHSSAGQHVYTHTITHIHTHTHTPTHVCEPLRWQAPAKAP